MIVEAQGDQRRVAVSYLSRRLEMDESDVVPDHAYAIFLACRGQEARGVILYKNYASGDVEMVCAGEPGWVTRPVVKFALTYPFRALGCARITCLAARKNKAMRNYLVRMGFKLEGVKRRALEGQDLMIYGLLESEAKRWD